MGTPKNRTLRGAVFLWPRGVRIPQGFDQPQLGSFLSEAKKDPKGETFALQANASTIPVGTPRNRTLRGAVYILALKSFSTLKFQTFD